MNRLSHFALVCLLAACGASGGKTDAGVIDTSCGFDCAAQKKLGLIPGTCFEYSKNGMKQTIPDLGVLVLAPSELEGGLKVVELDYLESGQTKMRDALTLKNGELFLVRRSYQPGQSVSFRDTANTLSGVKWLTSQTSGGENYVTTGIADVVGGAGGRKQDPSTYTTVVVEASGPELTTPMQTFDAGLTLVQSETGNHAADSLRVFVPNVGFVRFSTSFDLAGAGSGGYRLQEVRDMNASDGGTPKTCSLGGI